MKLRVASVGIVLALVFASPAGAVVPLKLPLSKVYAAITNVIVAKVTAIEESRQLIEAEVVETVKGRAPAKTVRVQIVQPAGLLKQVKVGQPLVIFSRTNGAASIHVADTWAVAQPVNPSAWRTTMENAQLRLSFPGRTAALVRLLAEGRGRVTLPLLEVAKDPFEGEVKPLARLPVSKPSFIIAADVNGDSKADLIVGAGEGVKLFLGGGAGFEDATEAWGLKGATGARAEYAQVGAKAYLLIGARMYVRDGQKFTPAADVPLPPDSELLALSLLQSDKGPSVVAVKKDGTLLIFETSPAGWTPTPPKSLWKGGPAPISAAFGDWGDDGKPHLLVLREDGLTRYALDGGDESPADFARLTGDRLGIYDKDNRGFKGSKAFAMDVNGDGRLDYAIIHDAGGLVLINRGFGAFFASVAGARAISPAAEKKPPFTITPATPCAGAAMRADRTQDLLVLTDDGQLYDVIHVP